MSIPGLPKGKRSQIFRAVEAILKADSVLSAVVKTWVTFDGAADSATAPPSMPPSGVEPPFPDLCPWVRLSLAPRRIVQADSATYEVPCVVRIEAATAGEVFDDQADLWEAIIGAMVSTKSTLGTTVENYLRHQAVKDGAGNPLAAQGGCNWYFEDCGIPQQPAQEDPAMLVGVGAFVVTARIPC